MVKDNRSLAPTTQVSDNAFWLAFIPVIGGLSIFKESDRLGDLMFKQLGLGVFALSLVVALAGNIGFVWVVQIGLAIALKLRHNAPPEPEPLPSVDFNNCSKHELVRVLNIPIVYANDIDLIRNEGHLFTHAEELTEIAGVPEALVERIAPQLIFAYDAQRDDDHTWRQMNFLTASEMEVRGVDAIAAKKIFEERTLHGDYRSAVDVKRRTGVAFRVYQKLV
ncbi:MAG: helix-hairpin-helix domain-containing protein [Cyanobacteria bacterium J06598_1]